MKRSIFIAFIILAAVVGWIGSGQFTNNVVAQDDDTETSTETETSYSQDAENNDNKDFTFSVETKVFTSSLIDQSIELQGQTIHNKKIDVKSETSGNIDNIEFARGDRVSQNAEMITISLEDRNEKLSSAKKDLERLNKEIILNEKNRDNLLRQNVERIELYEIEYASAKQLIDKGLSSKSKLSLASFNLANAQADREDIKIVGDRFIFETELLFDSASADLQESGKEKLSEIGLTLKETTVDIPSEIDWIIMVEGHTDKRPINTFKFPSNWELSTARANSVLKLLLDLGFAPDRLAAAGYGEFYPISDGETDIDYQQNRRIELKLTSR